MLLPGHPSDETAVGDVSEGGGNDLGAQRCFGDGFQEADTFSGGQPTALLWEITLHK